MEKLIVLTGAEISAESGLQTFRDAGGLWEGFNVYVVATPEAWNFFWLWSACTPAIFPGSGRGQVR